MLFLFSNFISIQSIWFDFKLPVQLFYATLVTHIQGINLLHNSLAINLSHNKYGTVNKYNLWTEKPRRGKKRHKALSLKHRIKLHRQNRNRAKENKEEKGSKREKGRSPQKNSVYKSVERKWHGTQIKSRFLLFPR